jgi:hypothetical protein
MMTKANWQLFTIDDKLRGGKKKTLVNLDRLAAIEHGAQGVRISHRGSGRRVIFSWAKALPR